MLKRFLRWIIPKRKFTTGDKVLYIGKTKDIRYSMRERGIIDGKGTLKYHEELIVVDPVKYRKSVKVRGETDFYKYVYFRLPIKEVSIKDYALINWRKRIEGDKKNE